MMTKGKMGRYKQTTLFGEEAPIQRKLKPLTPKEKLIFNLLKSVSDWLTYDEIRTMMRPYMSTVDNKVRAMVQKGYLERKTIEGKTRFRIKPEILK